MELIKKHKFISFIVLTYTISWLMWLPLLLSLRLSYFLLLGSGFGPFLGAVIITYICDGGKGLKSWLIMFGAIWGLGILGSVEPMPGSVEGLIYTKTTLVEHFIHEFVLGHFIFIKFVNIPMPIFSVEFGSKIYSKNIGG